MKPATAVLSIALALSLLAVPVPSPGQPPGKVYRIGLLWSTPPAPAHADPHGCARTGGPNWQAFVEGLREYGYLPGQNLVIECRWTEARAERAPAMAAELVGLQPDLIVVIDLAASVRAAMQATPTIPIVLEDVNDPVGQGLVASLAHPGGNVTGISGTAGPDLDVDRKRFQLLKEAVPKVAHLAVLRYTGPGYASSLSSERLAAARELGLTLQLYGVQAPEELAGAFAAMTQDRADALFVTDQAFMGANGQRIVALAAQHRLPAVYSGKGSVRAGGLISYGIDHIALCRRIGYYVDKIFKGAKPIPTRRSPELEFPPSSAAAYPIHASPIITNPRACATIGRTARRTGAGNYGPFSTKVRGWTDGQDDAARALCGCIGRDPGRHTPPQGTRRDSTHGYHRSLHRHPPRAQRLSDPHHLADPVQLVLFLGHGAGGTAPAGGPVDVPV